MWPAKVSLCTLSSLPPRLTIVCTRTSHTSRDCTRSICHTSPSRLFSTLSITPPIGRSAVLRGFDGCQGIVPLHIGLLQVFLTGRKKGGRSLHEITTVWPKVIRVPRAHSAVKQILYKIV
ncbi:hypothetical protein B0H63DRAFT_564688 [Podospora didyma]|uniref:Uncharacterized protein n=1 Tax=Podospora didyma TaxID=330526 RepID=A0AAE0N523_9PEZI|nr:hypothetical protein B0H63DRAFT_564688 [Podospora didyma]